MGLYRLSFMDKFVSDDVLFKGNPALPELLKPVLEGVSLESPPGSGKNLDLLVKLYESFCFGTTDSKKVPKGYEDLAEVLHDALMQSAEGKGKERHGKDGLPFSEQRIMLVAKDHGLGYLTGQAAKKLGEAHRLLELKGPEAAQAEILGAIVYSAAAVLHLKQKA